MLNVIDLIKNHLLKKSYVFAYNGESFFLPFKIAAIVLQKRKLFAF